MLKFTQIDFNSPLADGHMIHEHRVDNLDFVSDGAMLADDRSLDCNFLSDARPFPYHGILSHLFNSQSVF